MKMLFLLFYFEHIRATDENYPSSGKFETMQVGSWGLFDSNLENQPFLVSSDNPYQSTASVNRDIANSASFTYYSDSDFNTELSTG